VPDVVGSGEGGGEPVSQPPNDMGGLEEITFQFDEGC